MRNRLLLRLQSLSVLLVARLLACVYSADWKMNDLCRWIQEAANSHKFTNIINSRHDNGEINFDAKLSISNIDYYSFAYEKGQLTDPTLEDKEGKYSNETNVCERQGRCGLGCIADSRHSLDKKIYQAIINGKPIEIFPLCEVSSIEENSSADPEYR